MTLYDRLQRPDVVPLLGRPQQLSPAVEEALVTCLEMCAEFQYPMKKRQLQDLVQSYCTEHDVQTRWVNSRPGKHWVRSFKDRWKHRVTVKRPSNIKRSRSKVSPDDIRSFFERLAPNLEGVPPTHIFNYDESPIKDDPGAEEAFFGRGVKHCEQVINHSKVSYSIMFCCSAAGEMLPPMVVYKSSTTSVYNSWCDGGPDGAAYAATKSGWFDMDKFNQWFTKAGFKLVPVPLAKLLQLTEKSIFFKLDPALVPKLNPEQNTGLPPPRGAAATRRHQGTDRRQPGRPHVACRHGALCSAQHQICFLARKLYTPYTATRCVRFWPYEAVLEDTSPRVEGGLRAEAPQFPHSAQAGTVPVPVPQKNLFFWYR
jgi:DDE superfamily endonuclease